MSASLSGGSRKGDFKNAPDTYHAVANDEKEFGIYLLKYVKK